MSASPEVLKLAHTLGVDAARLAVLDGLPPADVRRLRTLAADALFEADRPAFARVASLAGVVPASVAAKLTTVALPPLLAARVAELLAPAKAVELVAKLPDDYLADVSAVLDAARAPEVVAAIPEQRVGRISAELARRQEWVVIAGFVAQVSGPSLAAGVGVLDGEALLRVGHLLDDASRFGEITSSLSDAQIDDLLATAPRLQLWDEAAAVVGHVPTGQVGRFADRLRAADDGVREAWVAAASEGRLPAGPVVDTLRDGA